LGYWRICNLSGAECELVPISAFTRVFNALWGVDRTRGLPHTRPLLNQLSFKGEIKSGAHTTGSNLGPLAYKASALTN
jgi:hypothetical protein